VKKSKCAGLAQEIGFPPQGTLAFICCINKVVLELKVFMGYQIMGRLMVVG
jgi:hypothetical protein